MGGFSSFRRQRTLALLIVVVMAATLLAACGDRAAENSTFKDDYESVPSTTGASSANPADLAMYEVEEEEADWDAPGEMRQTAQLPPFNPDRLVIRTATLTLSVENTIEATTSVRNIATTKGGFVFASTTYVDRGHNYAQLTIRVPSDTFDDTINELRSAGWVKEVVREESGSQDVSAEFVDNESRLAALEETQRRYMSLLSEADTIEDILRLESELTNIRTQIESIRGRQNYLSELTSFSTISVNLRPADDTATPVEDDDATLWGIVESAWERSTGALAGVAEVILVIAIFAVFFAPVGVILWLFYRFIRRKLGRRNQAMPTLPQAD